MNEQQWLTLEHEILTHEIEILEDRIMPESSAGFLD